MEVFYFPLEWCRSNWPGLFFFLSTLVCCQPTESILGCFCFINFPILPPPPPRRRRPHFFRLLTFPQPETTDEYIGFGIGWLSSFLYLSARIYQVYEVCGWFDSCLVNGALCESQKGFNFFLLFDWCCRTISPERLRDLLRSPSSLLYGGRYSAWWVYR